MKFDLTTLKKSTYLDLDSFAKNLREYLKISIEMSGGHYASPLGVVGITVAVHYVFNSPQDKLIFDTGHQCYAHKIITGRHEDFKFIRQAHGISGFPEPTESNHDHFRVGHAGTALAIAMGLSVIPSDDWVIVIVGDAAFANGVSLESLLLIHKAKRPVLIIVNDNVHSISDAVSSLRTMNSSRYEALALAADIDFAGTINGNEPLDLAVKLKKLKNLGKSSLIHVSTVKGYSDEYASSNPFKYHAIQSVIRKNLPPASKESSQEVLSQFLINAAHKSKLFFISIGMAETAGFGRIVKDSKIHYLDVGIAEHTGFTIAAAATKSFDFTFIHIYSTFLQRSADALLHDIGVNQSPVVLLVDRCGLGAEDGPTHHGIYDLAILRSCPMMEVYSCSNNNLFNIAQELFWKKRSAPSAIRIFKGGLINNSEKTILDRAMGICTHRYGDNITIISHGRILGECIKAADILEENNITCNVIELIKLHPISENTVSYFQNKGPVIIVEEHAETGSVGNIIAAMWKTLVPLKQVYITNKLTPHGDVFWQWEINKIDSSSIAKTCQEFLDEIKL